MIIPQKGTLTLEDGCLIARDDGGDEIARLMVGPDGLTLLGGELTIIQEEDPPKLRFASRYAGWRGGLGAVSFNVLREDGKQEEVGWLRGTLAEDATQRGDYRGQIDCYVRTESGGEPVPAWISSTAYTQEEYGVRSLRTYVRNLVSNLWKWS